ncbi:uncharacterized protein Pits isoform X2 [Plodia interpunctella]|nr:uncharacterized protein LOC128674491 isoform X2 [Plodia interpunctella]
MRFERPRYPVDRYLVESSKNIEMVNIIDDDIWNPEPALRPEDEIILRQLHDMLQSTVDDLKLLSGELSKYHEPGVQVKMLPTPLDDEFNEKVHIEEVVNAKFHGKKIIDNSQNTSEHKLNNKPNAMKAPVTKSNACVQVDSISTLKRPLSTKKKLEITRTKIIQIDERNHDKIEENKLNNAKINNDIAAVNYKEFSYEYAEPKEDIQKRKLNVQKMPSISIRSELTEQKVLHLDILPEINEAQESSTHNSKVAVITIQHETITDNKSLMAQERPNPQFNFDSRSTQGKIRKVSRMSTGDSSSANNSANDGNIIHKPVKIASKPSPKNSPLIDSNKNYKAPNNKPSDKKTHSNLEKWRRKLNTVYGQPSTSRKNKTAKTGAPTISSNKKVGLSDTTVSNNILKKNTEYIPYSQLTLGGVSVSDIEREISDIPDKNQLPLSPILDKILSSRENSFHINSPKKNTENEPSKILTTSDENLLQEVIDIEKSVAETLKKNMKKIKKTDEKTPNSSEVNDSNKVDSYDDDFEDEKSDGSKNSAIQNSSDDVLSLNESPDLESEKEDNIENLRNNNEAVDNNKKISKSNIHNETYIKKSNLSFKNKVDVFEFVHSVDTQESGTQSTASHIIALKETQTSPRNERPNVEPIQNDLWPSIDPKGEISHILNLEKELIKKLIIDEYGDLLEKNITKPSTSRELEDTQNNIVSFQKNTQTSPAHVKSVMTSPRRTKTRTTSPVTLSVPVDRQTSPMIYFTNEDLKIEVENIEEDLGISINLSSPRFSLRLPQNSRDVFSNFEHSNNQTPSKAELKETTKIFRKATVSSSSSVDADNSSSDISSLGEIKLKLKRRLRKCRVSSISDSSSSPVPSHCSSELQTTSVLPLRSEGEVSIGQAMKRDFKKHDSDGEICVKRLS